MLFRSEVPMQERALSASSGDPGSVLEDFLVVCGDGTVVELLELQVPGGKCLAAADFARGQGGPNAGDKLAAWKE